MTAQEIVEHLKPLGSESYRRILHNHGVPEPMLGVKIEELKKIQKQVKKNHELAMELFQTGIYDIQYLAGLIADESRMTRRDLEQWLARASGAPLCDSAVAWVAAESPHGWELALKWIDSKKETVAATGWSTLSGLVAVREDSDLDLAELKRLLQRVEKTIHQQPDRVRYNMNAFVIAVGGYVKSLTELAIRTAEKIGKVEVDMGLTACKVPFAPDYIRKIQDRGTIGKKRKTVRC